MPTKVKNTTLNASTIEILNVIRANATQDYQQAVPKVQAADDVRAVGQALTENPGLANQFLSALINRIALVQVKSATFYNDYAELKKGFLEFGETIEEVFVSIAKVREFSVEKAPAREFARTIPDVKSAFHVMNWRVLYPVTIQNLDLKRAFLSLSGVEDLIARIVDSIYTAASYDEWLLFKYLLIKGITQGKIYPMSISTNQNVDMTNAAVNFRASSNQLTFMNTKYNLAGVHTTTPKADQYIFMDANFNAKYDVEVLAAAFNMDKADFMGRLKLIDTFGEFDNDRWEEIRDNSDMVETVTEEELAICSNVVAVLVDKDWFQIYDNEKQFTEKYVASGAYWNYFYHDWKTVDSSPFSNAIAFIAGQTPAPGINMTITNVAGSPTTSTGTQFTMTSGVLGGSLTTTTAGVEIVESSNGVWAISANQNVANITFNYTVYGRTLTATLALPTTNNSTVMFS